MFILNVLLLKLLHPHSVVEYSYILSNLTVRFIIRIMASKLKDGQDTNSKISEVMSLMGKRSAAARKKSWGKREFAKKMRAWGKLGGRPKKGESKGKGNE